MARIVHVNTVIGVHLVMMGYGHWLANDPRGSGSTELRQEKFADLGPIHHGRRMNQPSKQALREFYHRAETLLAFDTLWFDERARGVIASAFARVCAERAYTAWSCAVLQNHAHLVLRTHRERGELMWEYLVSAARDALRREELVPSGHPVWSNRPYVVFKTRVVQVRSAIRYVVENPRKHGLAPQTYPWVREYDGFPFHKRRR